jgi:hypothetical protein
MTPQAPMPPGPPGGTVDGDWILLLEPQTPAC